MYTGAAPAVNKKTRKAQPSSFQWFAWNHFVTRLGLSWFRRKMQVFFKKHISQTTILLSMRRQIQLIIREIFANLFVVKLLLYLSHFLLFFLSSTHIKYASFDCLLDKGTKNDLKDKIRTLLYLHSFKPCPTWSYRLFLLCIILQKSYAKGLFQHKYDIYFCSKLYNTAI